MANMVVCINELSLEMVRILTNSLSVEVLNNYNSKALERSWRLAMAATASALALGSEDMRRVRMSPGMGKLMPYYRIDG
jgi:hypothetical protein